jgi:hypothetical protein
VPDGARTTAAWLAQRCRAAAHDARAQVSLARSLRGSPATAAALCSGEISCAHAAALAPVLLRARATLPAPNAAAVEATLLTHARLDTVDRTRVAAAHTRHALDPDGALAKADRDFDHRWLSTALTPDGRLHLSGVLDAEAGSVVLTALDALTPPPAPDDPRTRPQARADALVDLAHRQLDTGALPTVGGHRPHLTLTASLETLQQVAGSPAATLSWTGPIPAATARRICCDATLTRILLDPDGHPLHLGRSQRLISPAQRRALALRDGGCIWPGCHHPPRWCDGHHIRSWLDGGPTDLDNLVLLCRYHHRRLHEGPWTITRDPLGRHTIEQRPP